MKHDIPTTTKVNGAAGSAPHGDLDGGSKKRPWSEEDERRATDPYVTPRGGKADARQGWPANEQKSQAQSDRGMNAAYAARQKTEGEPARSTEVYDERALPFDDDRGPADTTARHKPYIVEAMAPPSVPPVVPVRSDLPYDARTDLAAPAGVAESPDDPTEYGAHGDLPPASTR